MNAGQAAIGTILALAGSRSTLAQEPQKFEVSSVRPNRSGVPRYDINPKGDRFVATYISLLTLVAWAYQLEDFRISGGPAWMQSERFDIEAVAGANPSAGNRSMMQFRAMLQPLLADRFHLRVHRETKDLPVHELIVAKGGSKLKTGKCVGTPSPANPCGATSGSARGALIGRAASMGVLAQALSGILSRVVLDKTELAGLFDFDLVWTPDETAGGRPGDPDGPAANREGPSIFTALQEQAGLKLQSAKGPVEILVIDGATEPAENE